eukprot:9343884-Alexandrium_andersonii.AAC.1
MLGSGSRAALMAFRSEPGEPTYHYVNMDPSWADYRASTIPIDIHGDGVETYNTFEYVCYSWSSALVHGISSHDVQLPICIVPVEDMVPGVTDSQIISFITWNLE